VSTFLFVVLRLLPAPQPDSDSWRWNLPGGFRILGAGSPLGSHGDDFSWMDVWSVYSRGTVERGAVEEAPPRLRGDALLVEKSESASAILYWNGKTFRWYQQGD
jgi:hypothetical protein